MQSVKDFIHQYYIDHKKHLDQYYPGLSDKKLLEDFTNCSNLKSDEVYLSGGEDFFKSLDMGKPLEYIQQNAYFYRANFYVDERVLIPRSETEILVEDALSYISKNYHSKFKIAEVGIGSFIIGLSILVDFKRPLDIWAGDISLDALRVAKLNQFRLSSRIHPDTYVKMNLSDRLNSLDHKVDLIISNPPYIKEIDGHTGVHIQTNKFEPHLALYLPDEDYDKWFESFFKESSFKLTDDGAFLMEGHEDCLLQLKEIAMKYFKQVDIKKDYTGRDRFLYAYL